MLRTTMIVLATAAALTAGLTGDALARGGGGGGGHGGGGFGGGHIGGGFGGGHIGGGFGGGHIGGGFGGVHMGAGVGGGLAGQHFAGMHDRVDHGRHLRFGGGVGDLYDYDCGYDYPYYNPDIDSCYPPTYY
jgi:hypothetical protein